MATLRRFDIFISGLKSIFNAPDGRLISQLALYDEDIVGSNLNASRRDAYMITGSSYVTCSGIITNTKAPEPDTTT